MTIPELTNLDAIGKDELMTIWHSTRVQPVKTARTWFPNRPKGYVTATHDLGNYGREANPRRTLRRGQTEESNKGAWRRRVTEEKPPMHTPFTDYHTARTAAQYDANRFNRAMGLEKMRQYGKDIFLVRFIPAKPEQRFGCDARCEVVEPEKAVAVMDPNANLTEQETLLAQLEPMVTEFKRTRKDTHQLLHHTCRT